MKLALMFLAVGMVYVAGDCNHKAITENCAKFSTDMQSKDHQKDKTAMCKTLNGYLQCMQDAGCIDEQAYKAAIDGMKEMKKQMECSAAGLVPTITVLAAVLIAFFLNKQ